MSPDIFDAIPENYEILRTIDTSGPANEYIARHKTDDVLVKLRMISFGATSSVTTRRHLREYLRCDISFMEELEIPGILRVFDYSDTKNLIWIATQPAEVEKFSERFDFLKSQSFEFRQASVNQFLTILQRIHNNRVVHRNLSSEAVFLSNESRIYIGDFGLATYISDQPTLRHDTISVVTIGYMPPELRNAETFACDISCDIFSAGLLAYEILFADPLPKDAPGEIHQVLSTRLNEQVAKEVINTAVAETILRATSPSPQRRWPSSEDFSKALETALQGKVPFSSIIESTSTVAITKPTESEKTVDIDHTTDIPRTTAESVQPVVEAVPEVTPLDPSHEIWNNRYEILEKIGEGGQAVVYKAYDHLTNEEIAIKTIWSHHRSDRSAINRLKQGAMIARSLTHPYIIKTYSVEQRIDDEGLDKYVFICMELIQSKLELSDVIEARKASGKKIRLDETLHIIRQLLSALKYAHEHTIHRDIKPGNIMLVPHNDQAEVESTDLTKFNIRLIDFGIAKVLSQKHIDVTGKGFRSAHYGAPELADTNTGVDARADIYSTGVIIYQMLTGNLPRKGSPPANKANKEVPASLGKVIDRAISADREKRIKAVSEFIKEIDKAVSKFRWLRTAAKVAAVVMTIVCTTIAVNYLVPKPDELLVKKSIEALKNRTPDSQTAAFADGSIVKYSNIEGYNPYKDLRQKALEGLETLKDAGHSKFPRSFSSWQQQEKVWANIEPAVEKIKSIAQDMRQYDTRKNLSVAQHLLSLPPSSQIVTRAKNQAEQAQIRLQTKLLKYDDLVFCADAYNLSAKVFTNIDSLADGSDTPQTAKEINDKLKNVEKLRNVFLSTRRSLDTIEQLKEYDFHIRSDKSFDKADSYYQSFALTKAEKYFNLLNQICGTIAYVRDEINFKRSDIGLISSRLMDLCHDDIETFENYPSWKEKLGQVHRKKEVFARYMLINTLLSKNSQDVPATVYNLAVSARKQYEEGNLNSANNQLLEAEDKYKKFVRDKIDDLTHDCGTLMAFSSLSVENVQQYKDRLIKLSESTNEPDWLGDNFVNEYNNCSKEITDKKNIVRQQLTNQAMQLKKKIIDSRNIAQREDSFWQSRLIKKYVNVTQQYNADEIDSSIKNWKYVDDLSSLSEIVNQMENINSSLEKMLQRKNELDRLANDINEGITFCGKIKAVSSEEIEKYKKLASELEYLRPKLSSSQNNVYLIDQTEKVFAAQYKDLLSQSSEILAKLPYHRSRVINLVNKTHSLEKSAENIKQSRQLWANLPGQPNLSPIEHDFSKMRTYLESIKPDVDDWPADRFNQHIQDRCKILADALDEQNHAMATIISAVSDERTKLAEAIVLFERKVNEILSDEDIHDLEGVAADNKQQAFLKFKQLPIQLKNTTQQFPEIVLNDIPTSSSDITKDIPAKFEISEWLGMFNVQQSQLDSKISSIKSLDDMVPMFRETREMLAQQSSLETNYYLSLRDYTIDLIDYSDISNTIDAFETDTKIVKMCNFLTQIGNQDIPSLGKLKSSLASIRQELASLQSKKINTLTQAKDFSKERKKIISSIAEIQNQVSKLNRTSLENSCKQNVSLAIDKVKNLIDNPDQTGMLNNLTSSLWAFFPEHKDWNQWNSFLQLHHITVSDENVRLSSSEHLILVDEQGGHLKIDKIAANAIKMFYLDNSNPTNFGWPVYVSHQKDPTLILTFVPAMTSGNAEPFYMAVREISNAQYKLFLEQNQAKPTIKMAGWACFGDQQGNNFIVQGIGRFPPSRITMDESNNTFIIDEEFKNGPVTWVTFHGAKTYAQWFGAQLPSASQYAYAANAGTSTSYPWGDELSDISSYGHVRSAAWQKAARQYNRKIDHPLEDAPAPLGAVKDFVSGKALEPDKIVHNANNNHPVWPCFTQTKPNGWGLYDMIGNVWEWCIDDDNTTPVICGGSCLCPVENISPDSKIPFQAQACDVGFRIVIYTR